VIELSTTRRRVVFRDVASRPVASLLRGFSAPVRLDFAASEADLITLISQDSDGFNRWQAAQTYAARLLLRSVERICAGTVPDRDNEFVAAIATVIEKSADPAYTAQAITLPGEADIAREIGEDVDPDAIHLAREALRKDIGQDAKEILLATYARLAPEGPYAPDAIAAGRRALRNAALDLFAAGDKIEGALLAARQREGATTMTDEIAALAVLGQIPGSERENALDAFYRAHEGEALVIDKWFSLQATIPESGTLDRVKSLMKHKAFSFNNPNRMRSLTGSFAAMNPTQFNAEDGSGYDFIAGIVLELDGKNPQVAARLLSAFKSWRTMESKRRGRAKAALRHVAGAAKLSPDVKDIAERLLA
jgi:aminopeptidase N